MEVVDGESFCSNSSADINQPKDYSLSSVDVTLKSDPVEANNNTISKSMKLNFGVERLLSKCDNRIEKVHVVDETLINRNLIDKSLYAPNANDHAVLLNLSASNVHSQPEIGSNQLGLNLLHQQLTQINNGMANQSFVLKPFPIRFGRNHNGKKYLKLKNKQYVIRFDSNFKASNLTSPNYSSPFRLTALPFVNSIV